MRMVKGREDEECCLILDSSVYQEPAYLLQFIHM